MKILLGAAGAMLALGAGFVAVTGQPLLAQSAKGKKAAATAAATVTAAASEPAKVTLPAADAASLDEIEELVLANHILSHAGVLDAYGHVSVRSSRHPDHFFLARNIAPGLVTAQDIIEYGMDASPVMQTDYKGYNERFIHSELFKARPDVKAVVHGHSPEIVAMTVAQIPLKAVSHMGAFLGLNVPNFEPRIGSADGEMSITSQDLGWALGHTLGKWNAVTIRGHGEVVVADSLHAAAGRAYYMTVNAREQMQAMSLPGAKMTYLQENETIKMEAHDGYERFWALGRSAAGGAK